MQRQNTTTNKYFTTMIDLNTVTVKSNGVRKYGAKFFSWATIECNGESISAGDPFPASVFPKYEAVYIWLIEKAKSAQVSETQFRQLFKGVKNGASLYVRYCESLEKNGIELI